MKIHTQNPYRGKPIQRKTHTEENPYRGKPIQRKTHTEENPYR
jgi:hypothetical protein